MCVLSMPAKQFLKRKGGSPAQAVKGVLLFDESRPRLAGRRHRHGQGRRGQRVRRRETVGDIEVRQFVPALFIEQASGFRPLFDVCGFAAVRRHSARITRTGPSVEDRGTSRQVV